MQPNQGTALMWITEACETLGVLNGGRFSRKDAYSILPELGYEIRYQELETKIPDEGVNKLELCDLMLDLEARRQWAPMHPRHVDKYTPEELVAAQEAYNSFDELAQRLDSMDLVELAELLKTETRETMRTLIELEIMAKAYLAHRKMKDGQN